MTRIVIETVLTRRESVESMIVGGEQVNQNQRKSRIPSINPKTDTTSLDTQPTILDGPQSPLDPPDLAAIIGPCTGENAQLILEKLDLDNNIPGVPPCEPHQRTPTRTAIAEPCFERLDVRSVQLERVGWWIFIGILGTFLIGGWLVIGLARSEFEVFQWIGLAVISVILIGMLWLSWFIPERIFATTFWQLKPHGLELRRGIWWRHRIFIPSNRIQHTDVQQGPIERRFELATLVVNTGGTHEPSISISGLSLNKAEELRDRLSSRVDLSQKVRPSVSKVIP